jgi:hypothetical protein
MRGGFKSRIRCAFNVAAVVIMIAMAMVFGKSHADRPYRPNTREPRWCFAAAPSATERALPDPPRPDQCQKISIKRMIGIGMPRSHRRIPLPMACLLLLGEGLNKRSGFRVPVDQMFGHSSPATSIIYATRVNARGLTDVNQARGI